MTPYVSSIGETDGIIIPAIITAHIAQSSRRCGTSHVGVIIQALAPVIDPYMSRAITTIQTQETSGSSTSSTTRALRSCCNAASRVVRGRSVGDVIPVTEGSIPQDLRDLKF